MSLRDLFFGSRAASAETSGEDDSHRWVVLRTAATDDTRDYRYFVDF